MLGNDGVRIADGITRCVLMSFSAGIHAATEMMGYLDFASPYAFLVAQTVKNLPAMQETQVPSLGGEDPLEKEKATHSSILSKLCYHPGQSSADRSQQSDRRLKDGLGLICVLGYPCPLLRPSS